MITEEDKTQPPQGHQPTGIGCCQSNLELRGQLNEFLQLTDRWQHGQEYDSRATVDGERVSGM